MGGHLARTATTAAFGAALLPAAALAASPPEAPLGPNAGAVAVPEGFTPTAAVDLPAAHRFRDGVVLGLVVGGGLTIADGYPNDLTKIGNPPFRAASGGMIGAGGSALVMGAFTDYLSFGVWFQYANAYNHDWRSNGEGGGLRVEAFPLYAVAPSLAGVGFFAEFGVGTARLVARATGQIAAEGTQSFIGTGAFYEWSLFRLRRGHVALGPTLEYDGIFSQPFERNALTASARLVFYGAK